MSKSLLVGLSVLFLTLGFDGAARAQYQDPLDAVYDRLNAQAQQTNVTPAGAQPGAVPQGVVSGAVQGGVQQNRVLPGRAVTDRRAYDQFMNRMNANLSVETSNAANLAAARRADALTTGKYEEKNINDQADFEREQLRNSTIVANRSHGRIYLTTAPTDAAAAAASPTAAAEYAAIEGRQKAAIEMSQINTQRRLEDNQRYDQWRRQSLVDSAENLRDQVLEAQYSKNSFGLQGVGTNLYVRQYGRPDAVLPPVHAAAARIVPAGAGN